MTDDQYERLRDYTELDRGRLERLETLTKLAPVGDLVECGTAKGGSAAVILAAMPIPRRGWLFDTFMGLPAPTAIDGPLAPKYTGANKATIDDVARAMDIMGVGPHRYHCIPGNFRDTFATGLGPPEVALLHVDCDWYDSVSMALYRWYPHVLPGGVIVLDDYGFWEGCRAAFYDFCSQQRITPALERAGEHAWWVK